MPRATTHHSRFELAAPAEPLRAALLRPEDWVVSWPHVRELVLLAEGDATGRGRRYRTTVEAAAPYALTWQMELVEVAATGLVWHADGDLAGRARVVLHGRDASTEVVVAWTVRPTPRWMRLSWPVARPLFVRNHDTVMRRGAGHLADHLDVALLRCEVGERRT